MLNLKKILYKFQYALILIPIILSIIAVINKSLTASVLSILLAVIDALILPICKKNENVWMFFMIAFTVAPMNIRLITLLISNDENMFIRILEGLLLYLIMLSIEEILAGVVTRIIWQRQRDFDDYEFMDS